VKATKKVLGAMLYSLVVSLSQFQDNPRPQKSFSRGGREEGAKAFEKTLFFRASSFSGQAILIRSLSAHKSEREGGEVESLSRPKGAFGKIWFAANGKRRER